MASNIVIKTDLPTFCPVYNPMEICVHEDDAPTLALTDYNYIFDVYISGVTSPAYKRYRVIPETVTKNGAVDISRFLEGYVYNAVDDPSPSSSAFMLGANAAGQATIIEVTVKYGYAYSLAGVDTIVTNVVTGSAKYVWNGSLDWTQWMQFTYNDYICNIGNGVNGQWLTDMKTHYVTINDLGRTRILTDTPTDVDYVVYKTYNSSGVLIQTATKAITVTQAAVISRMYQVATAPETINNLTGAWVTGAQPVVTSSVSYYTVQLTNSASAVCSELLTFYLQDECRYDRRRLYFVNKYGSFEGFNFMLKSTERREIERKGYKYDKYPIVVDGISRKIWDQAQVTNYTATQDFIKLTSDFITEDQNNWLKQLIESPEIYLQVTLDDGSESWYAVDSIVGTSWVEKQTKNDKLFNLEVEIKLSHKNYRQRR